MAIFNVTPASFDHVCSGCGAARKGLPYTAIHLEPADFGMQLQIICPNGCRECFMPQSPNAAASPTLHPDSILQVQNNLLLHQFQKVAVAGTPV